MLLLLLHMRVSGAYRCLIRDKFIFGWKWSNVECNETKQIVFAHSISLQALSNYAMGPLPPPPTHITLGLACSADVIGYRKVTVVFLLLLPSYFCCWYFLIDIIIIIIIIIIILIFLISTCFPFKAVSSLPIQAYLVLNLICYFKNQFDLCIYIL